MSNQSLIILYQIRSKNSLVLFLHDEKSMRSYENLVATSVSINQSNIMMKQSQRIWNLRSERAHAKLHHTAQLLGHTHYKVGCSC